MLIGPTHDLALLSRVFILIAKYIRKIHMDYIHVCLHVFFDFW